MNSIEYLDGDSGCLDLLSGESTSNAHGGHGGGHHGGGGHNGGGRGRRIIGVGGFYWNGAYWVDGAGICYTKNWLGQYVPVNCGAIPSVAMGI